MKVIDLFTDGGSNNTTDRVGGLGVVLIYGDYKKMFNEGFQDTTNNRTEMMAVIRGLEQIKPKNIPIKIHTDSAYVMNCFRDKWYVAWERNNRWKNSAGKDVENKDLWQRLLELVRSFDSIEWIKVQGHSGVLENELCDMLSTEAMIAVQTTGEYPFQQRMPDDEINFDLKFKRKQTFRY